MCNVLKWQIWGFLRHSYEREKTQLRWQDYVDDYEDDDGGGDRDDHDGDDDNDKDNFKNIAFE